MRYIDRNVTPDDTLLDWLAGRLGDAVELHVCTGFFDRAGGQLVDTSLREMLNRGGRAHLVVNRNVDGLPRYLEVVWALELFAPHRDRATLRLVTETELNSKVYLVRDASGHRQALVGSANFTNAGLTRNWETCLVLEDPDDGALLDQVETTVKAWQHHPATVPVDLGAARALRLQGANSSGDRERLADMLQPWLDRIEAVGSEDSAHTPVEIPTGFRDLDQLLHGLAPGQFVVVSGAASIGKPNTEIWYIFLVAQSNDLYPARLRPRPSAAGVAGLIARALPYPTRNRRCVDARRDTTDPYRSVYPILAFNYSCFRSRGPCRVNISVRVAVLLGRATWPAPTSRSVVESVSSGHQAMLLYAR